MSWATRLVEILKVSIMWFTRKARGAVRRLIALFVGAYLALVNRFSKRSVTGGENVVVSLTSYGKRLQSVYIVIESIARGTARPTRLILWVDDTNLFQNPPRALRRLQGRNLEIRLCENYGSHKKYYPALEIMKSGNYERLITADDDAMYPRRWLTRLSAAQQESPGAVVAYRARKVRLTADGFAPWKEWPLVREITPRLTHVGIGEAGVSYPRHVIYALISRGESFKAVAPRADDIWLHSTAVSVGVPTRQVSQKPLQPLMVPGSQAIALAHSNISGGENDTQIAATYSSHDLEVLRAELQAHDALTNEGRASMKVLIRTRPLTQGNYGGILQAYALQQVLDQLGHDTVTDVTTGAAPSPFKSRVKGLSKRAILQAPFVKRGKPEWVEQIVREERNAEIMRFVKEQLDTVELYDRRGSVRPEVLQNVGAFVVGSDQVWRAAFGRIPSYLLDFLDDTDPRPRVAYAASFGTDSLSEYAPDLLRTTRPLAQRLDAISVREASGRDLCEKAWGVEAEHVLDPTMLLEADHYRALLNGHAPLTTSRFVAAYVLDQDPQVQPQLEAVHTALSCELTSLLPALPASLRAYRANTSQYARPSIEQWLAAIDSAEFFITDSFHGTVFAILMETPFISIVNHSRGAARFESLLSMVGLQDRLVQPGAPIARHLLEESINWTRIRSQLDSLRQHSLTFLENSLAGTTSR